MTLDPFRTFCRLLLVEKAGGGGAGVGGRCIQADMCNVENITERYSERENVISSKKIIS